MWNISPIKLRHDSLFIRELTIGEAMEIAKIPESMNEARLTSFIGFVSGDDTLSARLTAQERYYILLNYLAIAKNDYVLNLDDDVFFMDNTDAPDSVVIDGITVHQLMGDKAVALESLCENIYDWLAGQMACQLAGDIGAYLGVDDMVWGKLVDDDEISRRFEVIQSLSASQFERLATLHFEGCEALAHCVKLGMDNEGLTLLSVGGAAEQVARFCPHVCFGPIAERLSQYLTA